MSLAAPAEQGDRALTNVRPATVAGALAGLLAIACAHYPLGIGGDYPNHLARTYIEGWLGQSPALQDYFTLDFKFVPDLAMDGIIPWLSHLIGLYPAGAVTLWLSLALLPLAGLVLARRLHGPQTGWLALLGFAAAFNMPLQWGFVNYAIGAGGAVLAFAFWIGMSPGWRRALVFAPIGLILSLTHGMGFLTFGYLALFYEIARFAHGRRGDRFAFARGLVLRDAVAFAPGLILIALSMLGSADLPNKGGFSYNPAEKVHALTAAFSFFNAQLALAATLVAGSAFIFGLRRGVLVMHKDMAVVCWAMAALVVVAPVDALGIWGSHMRFTATLFILLAASCTVSPGASARLKRWGGAGLGLLVGLAFLNGAAQMARMDGALQSARAQFATVEPGARILQATGYSDRILIDRAHATALAVIDRHAYVPMLFTNTSPVAIQPDAAWIHRPQGMPLSPELLAHTAALTPGPSENGYWSTGFFNGWPQTFDYVWFERAEPGQTLDLDTLSPVAADETSVLYKVVRPDGADRLSAP